MCQSSKNSGSLRAWQVSIGVALPLIISTGSSVLKVKVTLWHVYAGTEGREREREVHHQPIHNLALESDGWSAQHFGHSHGGWDAVLFANIFSCSTCLLLCTCWIGSTVYTHYVGTSLFYLTNVTGYFLLEKQCVCYVLDICEPKKTFTASLLNVVSKAKWQLEYTELKHVDNSWQWAQHCLIEAVMTSVR